MRASPSRAAPKLRLLRGTGRAQWVSTSLETVRHDGLELGVEKCPPTSVWAGQWEAFVVVRMPTEANRFRTARNCFRIRRPRKRCRPKSRRARSRLNMIPAFRPVRRPPRARSRSSTAG